MYRNDEKGFVLTDVILQLLFLVLFIFVLIWLFPTKGFVNNLQKQFAANTNTQDFNILYNKIFNENLISMKEAAINYYTTPRLPKNVGDKVSMSLGEMLDKKIVLPFTDKEGNSCSSSESYVEITKLDDEYQLKVLLSCSGEEEYLIVHLGCYQYCEEEICEKTDDTKAVFSTNLGSSGSSVVTTEKITVERPIYNNNITINNNNDCSNDSTSKPTVYYCSYVNGKYYGKNGTVVDKDTYQKECESLESGKKLYYEYRTKTLVSKPVAVKMCTYHPVETENENIYTLGYTGGSVADIARYPYAVKLPAGTKNIKIKYIDYGQENFSLTTWKNLSNSGRIYNYETDDTAYSARDTITTIRFKNSGLSKRHFDKVKILNSKAVTYRDFVELRIDYQIDLDRDAVIKDRNVVVYNDSRVGNIYYVPVKFALSYDVVSSSTKTKKCSSLTSKEDDYIVNRYTDYDVETSYEYGPKKWTTNPNLTGVEYTGNKEWK